MSAANCAHCRHLFSAEIAGLPRYFCPRCVLKAEEGFYKLRDYLNKFPNTPVHRLTQETGIPSVFVFHLYRLGRMTPDLATRKNLENKQPCAICRKALLATDKVYCKACNQVVESRMHARYSKPEHLKRH